MPVEVLNGLNELRILRLNGNYIQKIETEAFIDMEKIKDIQVKYNLLTLINTNNNN